MKGVRRVKKTRKKVSRHHTRRVKGGKITSTPSSTNGTINWNEMASKYRDSTERHNKMSTIHIANTMEAKKRLQTLHKKSAKNIELHNMLVENGIPADLLQEVKQSFRKGFKPSNV